MATKPKLGASLRNSISAEKKSIANKNYPINDEAKVEIISAAPIQQTASKAPQKVIKQENKPIASVKPDLIITKTNPSIEKDDIISKLAAIIPLNKFEHYNLASFNNLDDIRLFFEKIAEVNRNVATLYLNNLTSFNESINDYCKDLAKVNNPASFLEVNLSFFNKMKNRQQELLAKNMQLFGLGK